MCANKFSYILLYRFINFIANINIYVNGKIVPIPALSRKSVCNAVFRSVPLQIQMPSLFTMI